MVLPVTWDETVNVHVDFVFASEEYAYWVSSNFFDVVAVLVEQDGVAGYDENDNAAVIPGLTPGDGAINVNGINGGSLYAGLYAFMPALPQEPSYPEYFNDNDYWWEPSIWWKPRMRNVEYNGFTDVLTATAFSMPAGSYDVKLGIGDVDDQQWDAAMFIREGSFWLEPVVDSQNTGTWHAAGTWTTPDQDHAALIAGHTVTTGAAAAASSVRIDADDQDNSGTLVVGAGTQLTVGTDVWVVDGTLDVQGTLSADSNLPHGAGSELIIYGDGNVHVGANGTLEISQDGALTPIGDRRDTRTLVAGGTLEVEGTLDTGTLLLQEAGSIATIDDDATANVDRHIRVTAGRLTIDGTLNVGAGLSAAGTDPDDHTIAAVMVQGEEAELVFGPAAAQTLKSLEVAKGTLVTNRPLDIGSDMGVGANPYYVDDNENDYPVEGPVATVRIRCDTASGDGKIVATAT